MPAYFSAKNAERTAMPFVLVGDGLMKNTCKKRAWRIPGCAPINGRVFMRRAERACGHESTERCKKGIAKGRAKLAEKSKIIFPYGTDLLRSKQIKPQQILSQSLLGLYYIKSYLR